MKLRALALTVNRLIRISYGPFQLEDLSENEVAEIRQRVLADQLGWTGPDAGRGGKSRGKSDRAKTAGRRR